MNRFQLQQEMTTSNVVRSLQFEQSLAQASEREGLHYSLFAPLHYEPNYAYPLVIWLHGPKDDEHQLQRIMPLISMRNFVAISLRAPNRSPNGPGYQWTASDSDLFHAETSIVDAFDIIAEQYHIARNRVFLAGYQQAGTLAFRVALKRPRQFAGVLSVGGLFPTGNLPLLYLDQARHLPLFIAHCRDSLSYPVEKACSELRLFHTAGMHVTLRQYPCGDQMSTQMLRDMNGWMMEQITGVPASDTECLSAPPDDEI